MTMAIQDREKIVLETLEKLPKDNVVLIGGYAVNAYVPPRFSIDCDLAVIGDADKIETILAKNDFIRTERGNVPYGSYIRYVKSGVSFDLLVKSVLDRDSGIVFEGKIIQEHSRNRFTVGRSNPVRIRMRIADPEILFVMKFVTARRQDIRDLFMLAAEKLNWVVVSRIISDKCTHELIVKRVDLIRKSIQPKNYRHSLQGPYGKIPDERFALCKKRLNEFLERIKSTSFG